IDLGTVASTPGLIVTVSTDLKTSAAGTGFGEQFILGTSGGALAPPVLSGAGNESKYDPMLPPATIDGALTVSPGTNQVLQSATVSITSGLLPGDVLTLPSQVVSQTGVTSSYNSATGVLTLTGALLASYWQTVLDAVTFSSTAGDPSAGLTDPGRTISWQ